MVPSMAAAYKHPNHRPPLPSTSEAELERRTRGRRGASWFLVAETSLPHRILPPCSHAMVPTSRSPLPQSPTLRCLANNNLMRRQGKRGQEGRGGAYHGLISKSQYCYSFICMFADNNIVVCMLNHQGKEVALIRDIRFILKKKNIIIWLNQSLEHLKRPVQSRIKSADRICRPIRVICHQRYSH
jgi:hypothetical protein